ncbi:protein of unknown function [Loktanella atrilutea]|uniref:Uncharacterized protein n=1 Tax=Loktanella atrilutea TaxID=366533 RepID=A0A1M5ERH1_LOKAT|nr:DUF6692 family protein [Loktanella atrilutea]SHF81746.1 protein of unknown function [Loktanella atrilutea]
MHYVRFFAMIATSTVVMFGLMYLNSYSLEHVYYSQTRMWMALYMGAIMAIIMLAFMLGMYKNRTVNMAIFGGSAVVFALALWLVRSQETIGDVAWMKAMIPHHSIAILTSSRANITDPRVRKLADEIVEAQDREIAEMRWMIADIEANGEQTTFPLGEADAQAEVAPLTDALSSAVIASVDLAPLSEDEITRALPAGAVCNFRRGVDADPVFAVAADGASVTKVSGQLVMLTADGAPGDAGVAAQTEGLRVTVTPNAAEDEATLLFDLTTGQPLTVGYDGYWACAS